MHRVRVIRYCGFSASVCSHARVPSALRDRFCFFHRESGSRLVPHLISYAIGTLLGAAFLGLIPHALADIPASNVFAVFLQESWSS